LAHGASHADTLAQSLTGGVPDGRAKPSFPIRRHRATSPVQSKADGQALVPAKGVRLASL
jgi:hypothetical protein